MWLLPAAGCLLRAVSSAVILRSSRLPTRSRRRSRAASPTPCTRRPALVLGLPTGARRWRCMRSCGGCMPPGRLDFSRAVTFNLDEFAGVEPSHPGSFRRFMEQHLFAGRQSRPDRIHFLNGAAPDLDARVRALRSGDRGGGGIDLQILGIGANGHIGFNEPGDELVSRTHRVTLARHDAARQRGAVRRRPVARAARGAVDGDGDDSEGRDDRADRDG